MAEKTYNFTVMLNGDHRLWKTVKVKARSEEAARKKLDKKMSKIATSWLVDHVE